MNSSFDDFDDFDSDLLQWLLKGFDFYALKQYPDLKKSQYF